MAMKIAFIGFRHGHILDLYTRAKEAADLEVVGACEEHKPTRDELTAASSVKFTHESFDDMLAGAQCDIIAIGDYFARRGQLVVKALEAGKHVIADKPLCTRLDEVEAIGKLSSEKELKVGCMLSLRSIPQFIGMRNLVRRGDLGEIHAIAFGGQHPLNLGKRAGWYFEQGKHGGTIADIGIHAIDMIPWITGLAFRTVNAARCWNAFAPEFPHFKDAAQMMLTMDNGCGVLGDVSYFMPNTLGYTNPLYWRMTFFGRKGIAETSCSSQGITVYLDGAQEPRIEALPTGTPGGYLSAFLSDIRGEPEEDGLNTETVLRAARTAATIQKAADESDRDVSL